jgi:hypothetical protein
MYVDLTIQELVVLWHLLERCQADENYWNKTEVDFDDDFYEVELPDNFAPNKITSVEKANEIAKKLKEKLFQKTYDMYPKIKP